ncbi:MAG: type II toxin-antitoxin system VapC family toxin [Synechococcaceae cyanobacterium RL_1_2]|nr:type II toxin-antitoxin system VapC family toxin [Synechococcaceae cyanobacterium RL_1_2]
MKRLVLDAGPLIALVSQNDQYHQEALQGFQQLPELFGEVITPLPILFEVYKFVSRHESNQQAQFLLKVIQSETVVETISHDDFLDIASLVTQSPNWSGTMEDASVLVIAQRLQSPVWTIDYKDLSFFKNINFWTPN